MSIEKYKIERRTNHITENVKKKVRESDHTITLKNGKIFRKSDLAVKTPPASKELSPRKKNQLKIFRPPKNPEKSQNHREMSALRAPSLHKRRETYHKFEELDVARRNAAMNSSR